MSDFTTQLTSLKNELLQLFADETNFNEVALKIFYFQAQYCKPYRDFVAALGLKIDQIQSVGQIPFLPIEFFKSKTISVYGQLSSGPTSAVFRSSGTTSKTTSTHYVQDLQWYHEISRRIFIRSLGPLQDWTIFALLPGYLEQPNSSLIAMLRHFMEFGLDDKSNFYLNRDELFLKELTSQLQDFPNKKVMLWGVTHSLVKWVQSGQMVGPVDQLFVLETGGMKGHGKEMVREELHLMLKDHFGIDHIMGEYGMTELLSQAYSVNQGVYKQGPTLKIRIREDRDPLSWAPNGQRGLISVIDLANIESCSFIATQDIGVLSLDGTTFEVLGRADHADQRGCNLLID